MQVPDTLPRFVMVVERLFVEKSNGVSLTPAPAPHSSTLIVVVPLVGLGVPTAMPLVGRVDSGYVASVETTVVVLAG